MRVRVNKYQYDYPESRLDISIWGAPHMRSIQELKDEYRKLLRTALLASGILVPIEEPIDLRLNFIDPTSPDLDHLLTCFYQATDKSIIVDDNLFTSVYLHKDYVQDVPRK